MEIMFKLGTWRLRWWWKDLLFAGYADDGSRDGIP